MSGCSYRRFTTALSAMAVVLLISACRVCPEKEGGATEAVAPSEEISSSAATDEVVRKLHDIMIPEMSLQAPATLVDAVEFLKQASREYDLSGAPSDKRGVTIDLFLPCVCDDHGAKDKAPEIPALYLRSVSLYDALDTVCKMTGMRFHIRGDDSRVMIGRSGLDENWATRSYDIPLTLAKRLFLGANDQTPARDPKQVWQAFFDDLGVTGPEFASFEYLTGVDKLRVTNTPENLATIDDAFDVFRRADSLVNIEAQVHAFRSKDIERLRLSGGMTLEALLALRVAGKGKPIASASAWAKSGQEVVMKAVQEVRYPTAFVQEAGHGNSNGTGRVDAEGLIPSEFEVRETGMMLQVLPEIRTDGMWIDLAVNPQWISLKGWQKWPAGSVAKQKVGMQQFRRPIFDVTGFQTHVTVAEGETILLGSCSTPDGEWVQVCFLSVGLKDGRQGQVGRLGNGPRETEHPKSPQSDTDEASRSRIMRKLETIVLPEVTFRPPDTILDAMDFFVRASREHDDPELPADRRGLSFALKLPVAKVEPSADTTSPALPYAVPEISALSARFINLYDALKLICDVTLMKFRIENGVVWVVPVSEPSDGLVTRIYPANRLSLGGSRDQDWKAFFQQMGVQWPEGSSMRYMPAVDRCRVTNTPENLAAFENALDDLTVSPFQIAVEMQIHAFRAEDMERLRLSENVTVETLTALRKKGRSKPVASASVTTASEQTAIAKAVREIICPTELGGRSTQGEGDLVGTEKAGLAPDASESREIGMQLQVVPSVSPVPGVIALSLKPQWVTLDGWETFGAGVSSAKEHAILPFRQPVASLIGFSSMVNVAEGQTVLLGSCSTPDCEWVNVGFLTARRTGLRPDTGRFCP